MFGFWVMALVAGEFSFLLPPNSSYSGVPSLGGASLGSPPIHAGVESMTFSEMLSIVVEHDASATQAISKATTRVIIGLGQLERGTAGVGNG